MAQGHPCPHCHNFLVPKVAKSGQAPDTEYVQVSLTPLLATPVLAARHARPDDSPSAHILPTPLIFTDSPPRCPPPRPHLPHLLQDHLLLLPHLLLELAGGRASIGARPTVGVGVRQHSG
ncbi:hypothetical protein C8R46DRAFT_1220622 [Mycena filopes]|nr:hypothetical protein C8R46DRAFT_1220622 [Mycena filopes]